MILYYIFSLYFDFGPSNFFQGSELNVLNGDASNSNPENLPLCDCAKQQRYRVQICNAKNVRRDCFNDHEKRYKAWAAQYGAMDVNDPLYRAAPEVVIGFDRLQ